MKVEILDIDHLISLNKLEEVTSPRLFSNNMMYDPDGILSTDIFGISKSDRRNTFAYIDLNRKFLHPHIYANVLKRLFRNINLIVSGQKRYSIKNGFIIEDSEGWTGLANLYDKWEEIDWAKSTSVNKKSISLLLKSPKNKIFIDKILVCPPAYRDVTLAGTVDTTDYVNEVNDIYNKILRAVSLLSQGGLFARTQYATQMKIQDSLVELSDYFKSRISKKSGLIRRNLIGKSVDFGTRSVISAFNYNNETVNDNMIDVEHCAIPISQCCSTFYPFIETWLKNFFTRDIINNPTLVSFYDHKLKKEIQAILKNPEIQFSEKNIKKMINDYIFNPDNRFKPITLEATIYDGKNVETINAYIVLNGKAFAKNNIATKLNRVTTITDILYLACVDVCEKRHCMITRYPVGTDKGLFINKIRVQSTINHIKLIFNDKEYPFYPDIDLKTPHQQVGIQFVDTTVYNPAFLEGMGENSAPI
jgi:hypothetical protein